jgi:hypothetical protein
VARERPVSMREWLVEIPAADSLVHPTLLSALAILPNFMQLSVPTLVVHVIIAPVPVTLAVAPLIVICVGVIALRVVKKDSDCEKYEPGAGFSYPTVYRYEVPDPRFKMATECDVTSGAPDPHPDTAYGARELEPSFTQLSVGISVSHVIVTDVSEGAVSGALMDAACAIKIP